MRGARLVGWVVLGVLAACGGDDGAAPGLTQADVGSGGPGLDGAATGDVAHADTATGPTDAVTGATDSEVASDSAGDADSVVATDVEVDSDVTETGGDSSDAGDDVEVVVCVSVDETCNGLDDDCDTYTDEDTEAECFPYLCAGAGGCGAGCERSEQCAAGNWCDGGVCTTTGEDGAPCDDDLACASGHCQNGYCCLAGLCCASAADCALLDAFECVAAGQGGCTGARTDGVCGDDSVCAPLVTSAPEACTGATCSDARCDGGAVVGAGACSAAGACVAGPRAGCGAYVCEAGACLTGCDGPGDCAPGATCGQNGLCGGLVDGARCGSDFDCKSGHCSNGFCCGSGTCCGTSADCAVIDQPPTCFAVASCSGAQQVGTCSAAHRCELATRDAPEACAGLRCGGSSCENLDGLPIVLEGLQRQVCTDGGECVKQTADCRVPNLLSYCATDSDFYGDCLGCSPERAACVVFGNPCYCHD